MNEQNLATKPKKQNLKTNNINERVRGFWNTAIVIVNIKDTIPTEIHVMKKGIRVALSCSPEFKVVVIVQSVYICFGHLTRKQ